VNRAHTLEEIVEAGWAPSVRFLQMRLRHGEIKGRKVGREWKLSDADLEAYIDSPGNKLRPAEQEPVTDAMPMGLGLTTASARRRGIFYED
jgi:hypothetical protein